MGDRWKTKKHRTLSQDQQISFLLNTDECLFKKTKVSCGTSYLFSTKLSQLCSTQETSQHTHNVPCPVTCVGYPPQGWHSFLMQNKELTGGHTVYNTMFSPSFTRKSD